MSKKRYKSIGKGDTVESVLLGGEPNIAAKNITDTSELIWEIQKALNWYNYNWSEKDYRKATLEYLKKTKFSKTDQESVANASANSFDFRCIGGYCRVANLGVVLPTTKLNLVNDHIKKLIAEGSYVPVKAEKNNEKPKVSVQDRIEEQVSEYMGELELHVDELIEYLMKPKSEKFSFDVAEWTKKKEIKSIQAKMIADSFKPRIKELQEAILGNDPELKEAYSWMSKPKLKKLLEYHQEMVVNFEAQAQFAKSIRKPRKKKKKKPEQLVAKLKYQKECNELNIVSIDPREIIGAKKMVAFNSKYRTLTVYDASPLVDGFTIKGTTLVGYDEANSKTKKLRDPKSVLPRMIGGVRAINNAWETVKTKESTPNGRFNEHTVIIQVIK
jgi:hypothetical protein